MNNNKTITIALTALIVSFGVWWLVSGGTISLFESERIVNRSTTDNVPATSTQETSDGEPADIELATTTVSAPDGNELTYRLAEKFSADIAASGLGKARFMSRSPDGRIFVPDMVDYKLSHEGKIYILDDFNEKTHQFEQKHTYLSGLRGVNSVAFYEDEDGQQWIYIALTAKLIRYPYQAGDMSPRGESEVITTFPNAQVPDQESVVWHITRTIKFRNDRLFVSVGSGCDSCEQPEDEMRGMIYSMAPDGTDKRMYADGLRNAVGFDWVNGTLYATENGVDDLGPRAPDGVMYRLERGEHYGWPYCYEVDGQVKADTTSEWSRDYNCSEAPESFASFPPHVAPLGVKYFADMHPALESSFLAALHGSFEPEVGNGYKIVRVTNEGEVSTFMDGFLKSDGTRIGRPVAFLKYDESSFFFTDDYNGRVYYISAHEE